jgi:hypothetical protein
MRRETNQIGTFVAREPSGKEHTLLVFAEFRYQTDLSGKESVTRGPLDIKTEEGFNVDPLGNGDYHVIQSGLMLHSDDPNAPK